MAPYHRSTAKQRLQHRTYPLSHQCIELGVFFETKNQLPSFDQGTKSITTMDAHLVASSAYLNLDLVNKLKDDCSSGSVKFDLQMMAVVRFKAGGWRARRRFLRIFCDDLSVSFSSNSTKGNLSGGPRRCSVGI